MNTKGLRHLNKLLLKNSPTILTGLAIAGLFSTVVMAVKATPKVLQILEDARKDREEYINREYVGNKVNVNELPNKEVFLLTWQCYLPSAIMGFITITCVIGANSIHLRRNAALAGIYSLSEIALKEYQAKVIETFGISKERQVKDGIAKDRILTNPISSNEVIVTGRGETLCYETLSGRYFKSDIEHIRQVLDKASWQMINDTTITLNELYNALDLRDTKMGDVLGWHIDDGKIEPDFSSQLAENGMPCLVLDYVTEPRYLYRD